MFVAFGRTTAQRRVAVRILVWVMLFCFGVTTVQAANDNANDNSEATTQDELASLQQSIKDALSGFVAQLAAGNKGGVLKAPAENLVRQWLGSASMARRLIGTGNWRELTIEQRQYLEDELHRTVTRYLLEAADQYSGQQLDLDKLVATADNRRNAQLTLRGISGFDGIPVSVELIGHQGEWRVADFSVEGVSYSGMKRWQYEVLWRTGGFTALLDHIKEKNDEFFAKLASASATSVMASDSASSAGNASGVLAAKH